MPKQEWTGLRDRSTWPQGQWDSEPDKIQWVDEDTDLDCLMVRNRTGAWCGYVGITEGHPYFGVGYSQCTLPQKCEESFCEHQIDVKVHGGLTYANFCQERNPDEVDGVCHIPEPGRPHKVWWLGFDTAHGGDAYPGDMAFKQRLIDTDPEYKKIHERCLESGFVETYKDQGYVKREVRELARQLHMIRKEK